MASKNLLFHLLDTQARDIRIESETEESKNIIYEPIHSNSDSEDEGGNRRRRFKRFDASQQMELIIHMFGTTAEGKSVRVDVEGFRPTLYLELLEGKENQAIDTLRAYMAAQSVPLSTVTLKKIQRKKFYGFSAGKLYPFLEITVPSLALMRTIKNLFLNADSEPQTKKALGPPYKKGDRVAVYEANIDPMLRFFHVQNLNPCGWIQIEDGLEDAEEEGGVLIVRANYKDVMPGIAPLVSAPFLLVSWDIECYSRTGDFPVANKEWSKIGELVLKGCIYGCLLADRVKLLYETGSIGQPRKKLDEKKWQAKSLQVPIKPEDTPEGIGAIVRLALSDTLSIGDPVIQIGATVVNGTDTKRHLFIWPSCTAIESITVHPYDTEKAMINGWFEWLVSINPDILIGYNVFGFDERYLWDRAEDLGCVSSAQGLTRVPDSDVKCEEKRLSSSALGDNFLYIWTTLGRLQIDLFHYIKRNNASLPSYKLDEVTKYYLSGKLKKAIREEKRLALTLSGAVKDLRVGRALCLLEDTGESLTDKMVIEEIDASGTVFVAWPLREDGEMLEEEELALAHKWVVVKDDVSPADIFRLHCGSDADRAKVGKYCLQDCDLVLELYRKLEVFNNSMSMANVCCVPISYIFVRGQGIKAESLMFRACRDRGTLIPVLGKPSQGSVDSYEGAIVLDPVPGFYSKAPIGVADFASLYPSSIESENISHDSLVWVRDYDDSGNLMAEVFTSDVPESAIDSTKYGMTDIEFDLLRVDPEDKRKHPGKIKAGLRICRYAQPLDGSKATVPEIIRGLLAARKAKRKEAAKETDPMRKALLDAEQLAYKLTGNSLYGQLGSGTFKVRLQHLAASITAYGRKQIMFAKEVIERFYGPLGKDPRCSAAEAKVVYGDSVTGDTPLLLQKDGSGLFLSRIDELEGTWTPYHETKESVIVSGLSTWTDKGWTPIRRLIRHRLAPGKKLLRILTHTGVADVTEDHSLVLANGTEAKPGDIAVGTELLHNGLAFQSLLSVECDITVNEAFVMGFFVADGSSDVYVCPSGIKASWAINKADMKLLEEAKRLCPFETKILDTIESSGVYKLVPVGSIAEPARRYRKLFYNQHREKRVPSCILNAPLTVVQSFWNGFYAGDGDKDRGNPPTPGNVPYVRRDLQGKEISTGLALLAMRLGYKVSLNDRAGKQDVFRCTMTKKKQRKNLIAVKKIRELPHPGADAYVYDLETENHHFAVGPGSLIVHNTDSLFIEFRPKDPVTGLQLTGREARQAVIDLTAEAGHLVTKALAPPHDFEFDKVFDPMLMFSKKRYAGFMFEENADDYVTKYMGIALKRRDNAPIVKTVYGTAMRKLLLDRDVAGATHYVQEACMDLVKGKVKLGQLTITKSLRAEYANPLQIAHKALADRMAARDPGNAPASGDRIPFVYVQPPVGSQAAKLQGDRVEAPSYIKEKGLIPDYEFYLGHQLQNPISQMFGLLLEEMPGSDTVPWGQKPENPEKQLIWKEQMAAQILFGKAFQACNKSHTSAFVSRFFSGASIKTNSIESVIGLNSDMITKSSGDKKPVQSSLSSFMKYEFVVKNIEKLERKKRAEVKKAKKEKAVDEKPKNEIIVE